jgi:glycosyltransferase involved in cell wall biosynthesis
VRITHINTFDHRGGGAARSAYRLHLGLLRIGQGSRLYVAQESPEGEEVVGYRPADRPLARLARRWRARRMARDFAAYRDTCSPVLEVFSDDRSPYGAGPLTQLPAAEVVHLHWVRGFLDHTAFFARPRPPALVWTLHDMNPFTGGCHFNAGCEGYLRGCGACPQLGSRHPDDLSRHVWLRKQQAYSRLADDDLHLVAPSAWLQREARRSPLLGRFPTSLIPYGVDTDIFRPRGRAAAREVLGVPTDAAVVLVLASSLANPRKGMALFVEAFRRLQGLPGLFLLSAGGDELPAPDVVHLHLGRLEQDWALVVACSAADVLVVPSLQDNLPNVVLEAMACGLPVVGFAVGGIPEMVRDGRTGLLAPPGDGAALTEAMRAVLTDPARARAMGEEARQVALAEYSLEGQARSYVRLYERLLGAPGKGAVNGAC